MSRRLLVIALGAAAGVALWAARRGPADRRRNGARARTEQLRREIDEARRRLRDDLARSRGA